MPNEDTLLANARQSTKDEQVARRKAQRERLQALWDDCCDDLTEYARECIPDSYENGKVSDCETALQNVRQKLFRSAAQTRDGFLAWAARMLAKEPHFHLRAGAMSRFDIDVSDWIDRATLRHERYTGFPEHEKDGALYRVKMGESDGAPIVWTVLETQWEFAKKLWPVILKQKPGGFYIAKKIGGVTVPVHRLILNCEPGDAVQSTSGNLLDWTSLHVRPFNRSGIYEGRRMGWNKEDHRPNTVSEEFNARMKPLSAVETADGDERAPGPTYSTPANPDLCSKTTCWGKVGSTGWVHPITPAERDRADATERYTPPVKQSARMLAAGQALDQLGV